MTGSLVISLLLTSALAVTLLGTLFHSPWPEWHLLPSVSVLQCHLFILSEYPPRWGGFPHYPLGHDPACFPLKS